MYVLCDKSSIGIGNALVDTGSQVSLVTERSLNTGLGTKKQVLNIHAFMGNAMETKGQIEICIGEKLPLTFLVVKSLPMNCDLLLGQEWLERSWYQFQIPSLGITLAAYSESVVRIPTAEQGTRLVEAEELQQKVFALRV
jgi:hypothetical protein